MDPARRRLVQQLESLQSAGVTHLPRAELQAAEAPTPPVDTPPEPSPESPIAAAPSATLLTEPEAAAAGADAPTLEVLQQQVSACTRCGELAERRTQTVFGVGDPNARLCLMGEAPGADEDRLGEPFVGRAGQLLDRILAACGLSREQVYILNTLKCRPPGNRNPTPEESSNCRPFLLRQLELISPEFICCLGAVAAQNLLETTQSIGRLRGKVHRLGETGVVCTYHPAYLLRNPAAKADTWEDMKMLMRELNIELPTRK